MRKAEVLPVKDNRHQQFAEPELHEKVLIHVLRGLCIVPVEIAYL